MPQNYYAAPQYFCVVVKKSQTGQKMCGLAEKLFVEVYSHSIVEGGFDEMS